MRLPQPPPNRATLLASTSPADLLKLFAAPVSPEVGGAYLHWDELRHRAPPAGLAAHAWWFLIETARAATQVALPLRDPRQGPFVVCNPDSVRRMLHTVDRDASGRIELPEPILDEATRDRYVVSGLVEEAIRSSQLAGASTTRRGAAEMLRTGRTPRTHGERMILNNFRGMTWVQGHRATPLTPAGVLELHAVLTEDTLDDPTSSGRFRRPDERIEVVDDDDGAVLHVPPPASELPARLEALCRFATEDSPSFIHPVVRAILLHFWLAYDHPFVDGNGRTARALFYWQMLREGYWLTEFISISNTIRKAPTQYARAFLHVETSLDTTYFVLHQLQVLRAAIDELTSFVTRRTRELRKVEVELRAEEGLNHRQTALLAHAVRHPDQRYTIDVHRRSNRVVYQTARHDLLDLAARGLLTKHKLGRRFYFTASADLRRKVGGRR